MTIDWQSLIAAVASTMGTVLLMRRGFMKLPSTAFALIASFTTGVGYTMVFVLKAIDAQWPVTQRFLDLLWLLVAALLLVSLANFLRDDKPPFARYPFFFTLLPLIVLPVYPFISDTIVIKNWVLALYQLGALIIAGLLFSLMSANDKSNRLVVVSVVLFILSWLFKWIVDLQQAGPWVYTICLILGMILTFKSFYDRVND